ncbi:MAG TPA: hypothetical protein VN493_09205 [Thermoanaerobaculia bacterium]|nr:hypothetical protein [Thermoanaerobaculia bacterium]
MRRWPALWTALLVTAGVLGRGASPEAEELRGPVYRQDGIPAGAVWAVDPQDPGPNLPPAGRSLFDFLTAHEGAQRVPFPFSDLLAGIEGRLGVRLKKVLIPLGRSLQRNAADPEFFRYPRAVVAVDTEGSDRNLFLKDRLYLGYHEKAEILEVISYNEEAGRFEFQLVLDYRPGGAARVVYANRAVCTACHQGGGPLFSRPLWEETNANPQVAKLLATEGRDFYGLPIVQGVDVPNSIDDATDRANRIAVYQLLWREGCGSGESERAVRCRAAAFTAALQRRLSGGLHHDTDSERFRKDYLETSRREWEVRWPRGLAIPDPDIPNRDPLMASHKVPAATASVPAVLGPEEARRLGGLVQRSHVPAVFEPLNPRPPLEVWTQESGPARLITGLAELLADDDARRLDAALFARGASRERQSFPCEVAAQPERVKVRCAEALEGRIYLDGDRVTGGTIEKLGALRDLDVTGGKIIGPQELEIAVAQKVSGLHARRADGNAIELIHFQWQEGRGEATVVFLSDFGRVEQAVQDLLSSSSDAFSSRPFRRTVVIGELFRNLGLESGACCLGDAGLPPPVLERGETGSDGLAGPGDFPEPAVQALYQYCSRCHATPEVSPPNFLYGDRDRVRANLARCAERIFYRLEVWSLPAGERPKTPMPPIHSLPGLGLAAETWPGDPDLALLRQHAAGLLHKVSGREPRLADLETRGYESLQSCLP